ncbi:MAG: LEA type 2 family protein [Thiobacillus sp.]|nr:LEA type 2 family protein [Thiobacillus sp.]
MLRRLLVAFLALGLAACSGLPLNTVAPRVSMAEVDIRHLGLFEQHYDVGLRLSNPNDFDLHIEVLEFELELNGRPFAKGQSRVSTLIPATSSSVMRVEAITQSENLIQQIKTLPPDMLKEGVPYRIRGRFKTDRSPLWLNFDHAGVYGGDRKKTEGRGA